MINNGSSEVHRVIVNLSITGSFFFASGLYLNTQNAELQVKVWRAKFRWSDSCPRSL